MDERNRTFVWTNDKGTARKRLVPVGRQEHGGVRITSGVGAGDEVITEGQQKVSEGSKLTPTSPQEYASGIGINGKVL